MISKNYKPIDQYDLDGNLIKTHKSVAEAAKSVPCSVSLISYCVNGHRDTVYGYKWVASKVNLVDKIAKVFHLWLGAEFKLEGYDTLYRFTEENILEFQTGSGEWVPEDTSILVDLIKGDLRIQR